MDQDHTPANATAVIIAAGFALLLIAGSILALTGLAR